VEDRFGGERQARAQSLARARIVVEMGSSLTTHDASQYEKKQPLFENFSCDISGI